MNRTCQADRSWSGSDTICTMITDFCPSLNDPQHGMKNSTERSINTIVAFRCNPGLNLEESETRKCLKNRTWSGSNTSCAISPNFCPSVVIPTNGSSNSTERSIGTTVGFSCDPGYEVQGSSIRECLEGSLWSGSDTSCQLIFDYCPILAVPVSGQNHANERSIGTIVTFSCDPGYELEGSETRQCREGSLWDGSSTSCNLISDFCPLLDFLDNGKRNSLNRSIDSQ
eukprot:m.171984 g.171984  ORF g.171984 m.171984 type:complete len:227 (+) comp39076_c0_seq2:1-681(+)